MPFASINNAQIHYQLEGAANSPTLVFSNSLGSNLSMWDAQASVLSKSFRILRYDTRGHGQSSSTPGPYSIEQLANDVLALLDFLHLDRVHFCGLSKGGMIGMWLGSHAASRLHKLVLCNTGAHLGTTEFWNARATSVQNSGMSSISRAVADRWLTPAFRASNPAIDASLIKMIEATDPSGYAANCAAIRDFDFRPNLASILVPTFVIAGAEDAAATPAQGQFLAANIPGARSYSELPAAHLSNIECATRFTSELAAFLSSPKP
jgi:3-oxoadipate enol-lactonase